MVLRKAAEVEEIIHRITLISDMNAAFSGSKEKLENLQKSYSELIGFDEVGKADENWEAKLAKYAS